MNDETKNILIAGIGNIFLGDDAFGSEVARRMLRRPLPDGVCVVDFGIRGIDLAYALMDDCDVAILIDIVQRGDAAGTLYVIEPETGNDGIRTAPQLHNLDPATVFRLVDSLGGRTCPVVLVGCEPALLESEDEMIDGLSPPVAEAVDRAIELILSLIDRIRRGVPIGDHPTIVQTHA